MNLTASQEVGRDVLFGWLHDPYMKKPLIVKGSAGSGKSWFTANIISPLLTENVKLLNTISYCATTNQACDSLYKQGLDATTIHSYLGIVPYDRKCLFNPVELQDAGYKLGRKVPMLAPVTIVIDEAYRLDTNLLKIINFLYPRARLILIGDPFQTPPVGLTHSPIEDIDHVTIRLDETPRFLDGSALSSLVSNYRKAVEFKEKDYTSYLPTKDTGDVTWTSRLELKEQIDKRIKDEDSFDYTKFSIMAGTNKVVNSYNNYIMKTRASLGKPPITKEDPITIEASVGYGNYPVSNPVRQTKRLPYAMTKDSVALETKFLRSLLNKEDIQFVSKLGYVYQCHTNSVILVRSHTSVEKLSSGQLTRLWKIASKHSVQFTIVRLGIVKTIHLAQGITSKEVFLDVGSIIKWANHDMRRRLLYTGISRCSERLHLMR